MIEPNKTYTGRSTIQMYNCDCMELMQSGKTWDLAIVDPPYGIGEANEKRMQSRHPSQSKYKGGEWDKCSPAKEYFISLIKSSKNQIIWGANHFISKISIDSSCWVVWDKVRQSQDFADCELAWTSFTSAVKMYNFAWDGFRQGNMKNKQHRIHPTEKPIQLYKWLLHNYAQPNQTILDTHGGSMSIAIACWDLGFDLDICELDTTYFNQAVKRFENHIAQTTLF